MASWKNNPIMTWNGTKVTDHGRSSLEESIERIGQDKRMHDGTLRRQYIATKRQWSVSWENIPSKTVTSGSGIRTADGHMSGGDIESFVKNTPGAFRMVLRRGSAIALTAPNPVASALPYQDDNFYIVNVMVTEYSKEVVKRGTVDLWNISITLDEV